MLLDKLVGRIEDQRVSVAGSHYKVGKADREIVRLAEELGVGLIITGGRDLSKIERTFVGVFSAPYWWYEERRRENIRTHADSLAA